LTVLANSVGQNQLLLFRYAVLCRPPMRWHRVGFWSSALPFCWTCVLILWVYPIFWPCYGDRQTVSTRRNRQTDLLHAPRGGYSLFWSSNNSNLNMWICNGWSPGQRPSCASSDPVPVDQVLFTVTGSV